MPRRKSEVSEEVFEGAVVDEPAREEKDFPEVVSELADRLLDFPFDEFDNVNSLEDARRVARDLFTAAHRAGAPLDWERLAALAVVGFARGL